MRKAALITGLLFWVATSFTVLAQEKSNDLVQLPILLDCGPADKIAEMLVGYKEIPIAIADVMWRLPSGDYLLGSMTVFASPDSKTVSFVVQPKDVDDFACIAFPGNNFQPYNNGEII